MGKWNNTNERISQEECKGRLNAVADALFVIGGKWKLRIIVARRMEVSDLMNCSG